MGMTNEQFDSYKTRLLRELERVKAEQVNDNSPTLEQLITDLKGELKKP
jgi:hypothetical protein